MSDSITRASLHHRSVGGPGKNMPCSQSKRGVSVDEAKSIFTIRVELCRPIRVELCRPIRVELCRPIRAELCRPIRAELCRPCSQRGVQLSVSRFLHISEERHGSQMCVSLESPDRRMVPLMHPPPFWLKQVWPTARCSVDALSRAMMQTSVPYFLSARGQDGFGNPS